MPTIVRTVSPSRLADILNAWRIRRLRKAIERLESDEEYMARSALVYRRQAEEKRVELAHWER